MTAPAWRPLDAPSSLPPSAGRPSRCPDGDLACNCLKARYGAPHDDWCATRETAGRP